MFPAKIMEETRNSPISNYGDNISNLPDTLIHHILSFLDMKYVVRTSALARRWRYMWTSLSALNFDSNLFKCPVSNSNDPEAFTAFVNWALMVRDSSRIQKFHLAWYFIDLDRDFDVEYHVNTWILAAVRRNIQELFFDITLWGYQVYELPPCLFNCKTLTKLVLLLGCSMISEIMLPDSMDLPMLKSLKLYGLAIYHETKLAELFSSCPVLESLDIKGCNVNLDNVYAPNLKYLRLEYNESNSLEGKTIRIYAPNLISFICKTSMLLDYAVENFTSLVTADILVFLENQVEDFDVYLEVSAETKESCARSMMNLLGSLHNVKDLVLSSLFLEVISEVPYLNSRQSHQLWNLQCLKLRTYLSRDCFRAITYLLKISPNIESLDVVINTDCSWMYPFCDEINYWIYPEYFGEDWEEGLSLPCFLYQLKSITIKGVRGCINELQFLKILLKNAMVLEKLVFYCDWRAPSAGNNGRQIRNFTRKLIASPRASSKVAFYCF